MTTSRNMDFLSATPSILSFDHLDEFFQFSPLDSFAHQDDVSLSSLLQEGDCQGGGGGGGGAGSGSSSAEAVIIPSPGQRQRKQRSRKRTSPYDTCRSANDAAAADGNGANKKVIHRDIERQRRKEMAALYGSLRSHLSVELLKGKQSVSDHVHQAVNYIRHQQNKIRVLSEKRDELKRRTELRADQPDSTELPGQSCFDPRDTVIVNPCLEGVEIIINTSGRQGIPTSGILKVLMRGGLDIIRTNSTQLNERVVHSIHAKVEDRGNVNLADIHQKLMSLRAR
ncbi:hypothetical protein MLD38_016550 [Melastoma candidum]|uniref:Uncharacterized protein n=1 Tax=Melastoma candidum TaxID=119954 RepID=A0ACB9QVY7_9MYRT|nr:hypothetical protein MLD38_016550 [Melastoma candidum]